AALAIVPWSMYASREEGEFVPVTSGGAPALWVGTFLPGEGSLSGLKRACLRRDPELRYRPERGRHRCAPVGTIVDGVARLHPELGSSAALRKATRQNLERYALGRPGAFAGMMLDKVQRMWLDYTRGGGRSFEPGINAIHLSLLGLSLLGLLAGLVRARQRLVLGLILVVVATTTLLHSLATALPRYAVVVIPLLLAGGAAGGSLARAGRRDEAQAAATPIKSPPEEADTVRRPSATRPDPATTARS
ncbi:MAG: hypothetical protein M3N16_06410, partial [Actinomycetota bacterium]|nr:hypothetical protein [Actinomycetota bacterium]